MVSQQTPETCQQLGIGQYEGGGGEAAIKGKKRCTKNQRQREGGKERERWERGGEKRGGRERDRGGKRVEERGKKGGVGVGGQGAVKRGKGREGGGEERERDGQQH